MRCQLINPLCPDDLCILDHGHKGTKRGIHHLGTSSEPFKVGTLMRMSNHDKPFTDEELINLGQIEQRRLVREGKINDANN